MPAPRGREGSRRPSRARAASRGVSSPEEAARPDDEDDHEDDESHDLPVRASEDGRAQGLRHPEEDPGDKGIDHGAEPGEHDDDQRLEGPLQSYRRADRGAYADEAAGGAGETCADGEGQEVGATDIDAGQKGGLPILGRRPDGLAPSPMGQQELQAADEDEGDGEAQETYHGDREVPKDDDGAAIGRDDGSLVRGPEPNGEGMQHQRQPEADQQGGPHPRLFVGADDKGEERSVQTETEKQRERNDEQERGERIDAEQGDEPERPIAAEHDQLAVGDIEDLEDAKDEREANRGQPVESAEQDPEDELLGEGVHPAAVTPTALGALTRSP